MDFKPYNNFLHNLNMQTNRLSKSIQEIEESKHASGFYKRLVELINDFDSELDNYHEVGIRLVSFGQTVTFHVTDLGYYNPSLIIFYGVTEDGNPVELIQHISQISFLLTKVKRLDPTKPKQPIGFKVDEGD